MELNFWINEVENYIVNKCFISLIGNKIDLFEDEQISENDVKDFAKQRNYRFTYFSAKTGKGTHFIN